ncbi:MAG: hypothetical protein N3A57_00430 [Negativicutes bacterium]|nr:hypothetical protein [Negativicutes bacterium]
MINCASCGRGAPESVRFCVHCGHCLSGVGGDRRADIVDIDIDEDFDVRVDEAGDNDRRSVMSIDVDADDPSGPIVSGNPARAGTALDIGAGVASLGRTASGRIRLYWASFRRNAAKVWQSRRTHPRVWLAALFSLLFLTVGLCFFLWTFKHIEIARWQREGNIAGLREMIGQGKSWFFCSVGLNAAGAVLVAGNDDDRHYVGSIIDNPQYPPEFREKLIDVFGQYGVLVPQLFAYLDSSLPGNYKQLLARASVRVDPEVSNRKIGAVIEEANRVSPCKAAEMLEHCRVYDPMRENTGLIERSLYVKYLDYLGQTDYRSNKQQFMSLVDRLQSLGYPAAGGDKKQIFARLMSLLGRADAVLSEQLEVL